MTSAILIRLFRLINICLRTQDDYRLIAYAYGLECARQNIRYAEVTFSIETNLRKSGLPWQAILEALEPRAGAGPPRNRRGAALDLRHRARPSQDPGPGAGDRPGSTPARAVSPWGWAAARPATRPGCSSRPSSAPARPGCRVRPTPGRLPGRKSVWGALDLLHADRLAHGVRSIEDPVLVEILRQRQIALDICPTSNVRLGVYPGYAAHPLRRLWEAGF